MKRPLLFCLLATLAGAAFNAFNAFNAFSADVTGLRCEYLTDPPGIDTLKPRLSWIVASDRRGEVQTAYQLLVASTPDLLARDKADLWDSGKVATDRQNQIEYEGRPLESRTACFWKVRIWDKDGAPSAWSPSASWSMGLLKPEDWQAKWIGVNEPLPRHPVLRILKAVLQGASDTPAVDVTTQLAGKITNNRLSVIAKADTLGLPSATDPTAKRKLLIDYEIGGTPQPRSVLKEGAALVLGAPQDWPVPRYLRKAFPVERAVRRATIYATALGLYELRLNGQRVGDHLLAPEWTNYHRRVQVQTYDVTSLVRPGQNVLGAALGNGWYCGGWQHWKPELQSIYGTEPHLLAQLEIEFTDGTRQQVATDSSWRGSVDGPLRFAGIYEGETYDATREMPGWDSPGFDDAAWSPAKPAPADLQTGQLAWQRNEPIRKTREIKPVSVTVVKPGVYVFAFDQNMAGWCRFSFHGKPGQTVELQHGEMRNPDGTVFLDNLLVVSRHRIQLDRYTFRTDQVESWEPRFTYHGFQYVEVRGLTEKPDLASLTGVVINSDCPEVGRFTCSEPLLNRLADNILWSQRSNYRGVPTDCPQRNERCGYTGDANFFMRAAVFNMDVAAFFNKWLVDVCEDSQMPDGHFADHAPTFGPGDGPNAGWSDGGIICPFEIYRTYGDTRVIREHYAAMKRNLEYLARNSKDDLFIGKVGNGDWLSNQGGADKAVIGSAFAAFDFRLMAEMAEAIGEKGDATAFRERAPKMAGAFATAYIAADGSIKNSSQTGYAMAFTMGLVPASLKEAMTMCFLEEMRKFDWHPRTGFIGTPRLLPGLHLAGLDDAAYKALLTKTSPSWLYPVTVGATTIWERWNAWDGKTPRGGMNSLNHYSFGSVGEYLYGIIGGIQPDAPGYQKIRIAPVIRDGLTWANASYDSIRGRIVSNWKLEGSRLTMDVTIPPNTTATVHVPADNAASVTESGKPCNQAPGVKYLRMENGAALFEVGAGSYHFESAHPVARQNLGEGCRVSRLQGKLKTRSRLRRGQTKFPHSFFSLRGLL
jgi:alpha-L-rhamnosidase